MSFEDTLDTSTFGSSPLLLSSELCPLYHVASCTLTSPSSTPATTTITITNLDDADEDIEVISRELEAIGRPQLHTITLGCSG